MIKLRDLIICGFLLFSVSCAEGFLGYDELRFFEEPKEDRGAEEEKKIEDIWTEPIVGPDGRLTYHRPPEAVLQFIENPTEENAEVYLAWNRKRFESYQKAQEVLRQVMEKQGDIPVKTEKTSSLAVSSKQTEPAGAAKQTKARVWYFIDPDCAYCEQAMPIVNAFARKYQKDLEIQGITLASNIAELNQQFAFPVAKDAGEIKQFGISTYPTMVFSMPSGNVFGIRGFAERDVLERIWQEERQK